MKKNGKILYVIYFIIKYIQMYTLYTLFLFFFLLWKANILEATIVLFICYHIMLERSWRSQQMGVLGWISALAPPTPEFLVPLVWHRSQAGSRSRRRYKWNEPVFHRDPCIRRNPWPLLLACPYLKFSVRHFVLLWFHRQIHSWNKIKMEVLVMWAEAPTSKIVFLKLHS